MHKNLFPDILINSNKNSTLNTSFLNENFSTSSFVFDDFKNGLRSTQQIKIDYSLFENHTFFNNAVAKTNSAFEKIINRYPYDGTKQEINNFYDNLTGFEKYFLDNFPHNFGFIDFKSADENYIIVNDFQGINEFADLSNDNNEGKSVLSPGTGSFTVEFHFKPPTATGQTEIILQKKNSSENIGYSVFVSSSIDPKCEVVLSVFSGSTYINSIVELEREKFSHVAFVFDNSALDFSNIFSYINGSEVSQNISSLTKINSIDIGKFNFLIGSGSSFFNKTEEIIPTSTLSGSLDELRFFSNIISSEKINFYSDKNVFSTNDLKLYYKFNESDDISTDNTDLLNSICLDSSGNSLHSYIENFDFSVRKKTLEDNTIRLKNEKKKFNPVLFPGNSAIRQFYTDLLDNAREFDKFNPNLITKLIPKHYLIDGQLLSGTDDIEGNSNDNIDENVAPGNFSIGNVQLMVSFLFTIASFYDELKLFLDSFCLVNSVNYDAKNDSPDDLLDRILEKFGISANVFLNNKNFEHYFLGEYTVDGINFDNIPLKEIQKLLLRYVASDIKNILASKGTIDSLKYFIRSLGLDPETSMKFVEYGSNEFYLSSLRENKKIIDKMIKFQTSSYVQSDFFVSDRIETDGPQISNSINDNLLSSGSWSISFCAKFYENDDIDSSLESSLCRLYSTGSSVPSDEGCVVNLISSQVDKSIKLVFNSSTTSFVNNVLELKNIDIQDGERWNISFGREVNYQSSPNNTKYFIRAGRLKNIDNIVTFYTSSYFNETNNNVFNEFSSNFNTDGIFAVFGEGFQQNIFQTNFIQNSINELITGTSFRISNFKFFSKEISDIEFLEHTKNPFSVGIDNFISNDHYERIRSHNINRWNETKANTSGDILFLDSTKNNISLFGKNFDPESKVLFPDIVYHTSLPTQIDETISKDKIFLSNDDINFKPKYDNRFEIQISLLDYLNDDIIRHLSSTQFLENVLGSSELLFDINYNKLEKAKEEYFERLKSKLNFKSFKETYDFIYDSLDDFIQELIPERTRFKGVNYIIQQSLLERYKINYKLPEFYAFKDLKFNKQELTLDNSISVGLLKGSFE